MQPRKIDADRAGLKLIRPAITLLVALAALPAPSTAQGPGPVGLRQPDSMVAARKSLATSPWPTETINVKPNHWKRGAVILSLGALGALVGGFIGSFFPK